jgi:hypothetical protein
VSKFQVASKKYPKFLPIYIKALESVRRRKRVERKYIYKEELMYRLWEVCELEKVER